MALNVHKTLKHDPNYIRHDNRGKNNPMYGKSGRNQWYYHKPIPILERDFSTLKKKAIRFYLLEKFGYKCWKCGFDKNIFRTNKTCILQVHHIDGNAKNNEIENLQILCPNCHALTENYGFNHKHLK